MVSLFLFSLPDLGKKKGNEIKKRDNVRTGVFLVSQRTSADYLLSWNIHLWTKSNDTGGSNFYFTIHNIQGSFVLYHSHNWKSNGNFRV